MQTLTPPVYRLDQPEDPLPLTSHPFVYPGVLAKTGTGKFAKWSAMAGDGYSKRKAEATVNINDKLIALGMQARSHTASIHAPSIPHVLLNSWLSVERDVVQ